MLVDAFIKDVLKIAGNDPKRVLFLLRGDDQKEVFASKFSSLGFETLDADAATELKSDLYPPHFYNDLHWNGRGIERICSAVCKTEFFDRIVRRASKKDLRGEGQ